MLDFLFNRETKIDNAQSLNEFYSKVKSQYDLDSISEERKQEVENYMKEYGYIPYSYSRALDELSNEEVLFALQYFVDDTLDIYLQHLKLL